MILLTLLTLFHQFVPFKSSMFMQIYCLWLLWFAYLFSVSWFVSSGRYMKVFAFTVSLSVLGMDRLAFFSDFAFLQLFPCGWYYLNISLKYAIWSSPQSKCSLELFPGSLFKVLESDSSLKVTLYLEAVAWRWSIKHASLKAPVPEYLF